MKGCIVLFIKKGDLGITDYYSNITVTTIHAQVYNVQLLNCIWSGVEKILRKNQNYLQSNWSITSDSICWIIEGVHAKNLETTLIWLFVDFSSPFNSIHRGKMVDWVLWHINPCRLFNAKSCLYIYIYIYIYI